MKTRLNAIPRRYESRKLDNHEISVVCQSNVCHHIGFWKSTSQTTHEWGSVGCCQDASLTVADRSGMSALGYLQGGNVLYELEDPETQIGRAEQNDIVSWSRCENVSLLGDG